MKRLGRGGNNIVFLDPNAPVVWRLGTANSSKYIRDLQRALSIQKFFLDNPEIKSALGPCIVRFVSADLHKFKTLPERFSQALKLPEDEKVLGRITEKTLFVASMTESLSTSDSFMHKNLNSHMFLLTWFLVTAQHTCNFVHRDIKPNNICFRKFESASAKTYAFDLFDDKAEGQFVLKNLTCVPVLIDYDFASIHLTLPENRKTGFGTPLYMSPTVYSRKKNAEISPSTALRQDMASDWFALGLTFVLFAVNNVTDVDVDNNGIPELLTHAIEKRYKDLDFTNMDWALFEQYLWVTRIVKADVGLPAGDRRTECVQRMIDTYASDPDIIRNCKKLRRAYKEHTTPRQREMISNMLSWDDEKRLMNGGAVYRYLEFFMDDFYETDAVEKIDMSYGLFSSSSSSSFMLDPGEEDKGVLIPDDGDLQKFKEIRSQLLL